MRADGKGGNRLVGLWRAASEAARRVITPVLLLLIFILLFIPVGVAMRVLRRDPLRRGFPGPAGSLWTRPRRAAGGYSRQFQ